MKLKKTTIEKKSGERNVVTAILGFSLLLAVSSVSQAGEICPPNLLGPDICVSFDEGTPIAGTHFRVDYTTDAANPSVELLVGSQTWNVRSDASREAGNIGNITLAPTDDDFDFEVKITHGLVALVVGLGAGGKALAGPVAGSGLKPFLFDFPRPGGILQSGGGRGSALDSPIQHQFSQQIAQGIVGGGVTVSGLTGQLGEGHTHAPRPVENAEP